MPSGPWVNNDSGHCTSSKHHSPIPLLRRHRHNELDPAWVWIIGMQGVVGGVASVTVRLQLSYLSVPGRVFCKQCSATPKWQRHKKVFSRIIQKTWHFCLALTLHPTHRHNVLKTRKHQMIQCWIIWVLMQQLLVDIANFEFWNVLAVVCFILIISISLVLQLCKSRWRHVFCLWPLVHTSPLQPSVSLPPAHCQLLLGSQPALYIPVLFFLHDKTVANCLRGSMLVWQRWKANEVIWWQSWPQSERWRGVDKLLAERHNEARERSVVKGREMGRGMVMVAGVRRVRWHRDKPIALSMWS